MSQILTIAEQKAELHRLSAYIPGGVVCVAHGDVPALWLGRGYEICRVTQDGGFDLWHNGEPAYGKRNEYCDMQFMKAAYVARDLIDQADRALLRLPRK